MGHVVHDEKCIKQVFGISMGSPVESIILIENINQQNNFIRSILIILDLHLPLKENPVMLFPF